MATRKFRIYTYATAKRSLCDLQVAHLHNGPSYQFKQKDHTVCGATRDKHGHVVGPEELEW